MQEAVALGRAAVLQRIHGKPPIPVEIVAILAEQKLSAMGLLAWWVMPNGYLVDAGMPCNEWGQQPAAVLQAARNARGTYVA